MDSCQFKLKVELLFAPEGQLVTQIRVRLLSRPDFMKALFTGSMGLALFCPLSLTSLVVSQSLELTNPPLWSIVLRSQNRPIALLVSAVTYQRRHKDVKIV